MWIEYKKKKNRPCQNERVESRTVKKKEGKGFPFAFYIFFPVARSFGIFFSFSLLALAFSFEIAYSQTSRNIDPTIVVPSIPPSYLPTLTVTLYIIHYLPLILRAAHSLFLRKISLFFFTIIFLRKPNGEKEKKITNFADSPVRYLCDENNIVVSIASS